MRAHLLCADLITWKLIWGRVEEHLAEICDVLVCSIMEMRPTTWKGCLVTFYLHPMLIWFVQSKKCVRDVGFPNLVSTVGPPNWYLSKKLHRRHEYGDFKAPSAETAGMETKLDDYPTHIGAKLIWGRTLGCKRVLRSAVKREDRYPIVRWRRNQAIKSVVWRRAVTFVMLHYRMVEFHFEFFLRQLV